MKNPLFYIRLIIKKLRDLFMKKFSLLFFFLFLLPLVLLAKAIDTFYGTIEVNEPVLIELIDSEAFQRLKKIHQYGVAYYTTSYKEEYTRYDHSLGVFAILRTHGASIKEQIAGLLHDVSHTVFSHVGDWIFEMQNQEKDYQNRIYCQFLKERGIEEILKKYGYRAKEFLPVQDLFPMLESPLPSLCADRIDYNIQGAFYQGFLTYEEALEIFQGIKFTGKIWISDNPDLMTKLALFSFFMTENCWGSVTNALQSRWFADAILRAKKLQDITDDMIHFGTDQEIWDILKKHADRSSYTRKNLSCRTC